MWFLRLQLRNPDGVIRISKEIHAIHIFWLFTTTVFSKHVVIKVPYHVHTVHHHHVEKVHVPVIKKEVVHVPVIKKEIVHVPVIKKEYVHVHDEHHHDIHEHHLDHHDLHDFHHDHHELHDLHDHHGWW